MERDTTLVLGGRDYTFGENSLKYDNTEIIYAKVRSYNHALTHKSYTILQFALVKFFNILRAKITFVLEDGREVIISKSITSPLAFISNNQKDLMREYAEFINKIDALLEPVVVPKIAKQVISEGSLKIGNILRITQNEITVLLGRKSKSLPLSKFSHGKVTEDMLYVYDNDGNIFTQITLRYMNSVLIPSVLSLLKDYAGTKD